MLTLTDAGDTKVNPSKWSISRQLVDQTQAVGERETEPVQIQPVFEIHYWSGPSWEVCLVMQEMVVSPWHKCPVQFYLLTKPTSVSEYRLDVEL